MAEEWGRPVPLGPEQMSEELIVITVAMQQAVLGIAKAAPLVPAWRVLMDTAERSGRLPADATVQLETMRAICDVVEMAASQLMALEDIKAMISGS